MVLRGFDDVDQDCKIKANWRLRVRDCLHIVFPSGAIFRSVRLFALRFFFNAMMRAARICACFAAATAQAVAHEQRRLFRASTPRGKNPRPWWFVVAATTLLRRAGDEGRDEGEGRRRCARVEARRGARGWLRSESRRAESVPEGEMLPHRSGTDGRRSIEARG